MKVDLKPHRFKTVRPINGGPIKYPPKYTAYSASDSQASRPLISWNCMLSMSSSPYANPHKKKRIVVSAIGAMDSRLFSLSMLAGFRMLTKSKNVVLLMYEVLVAVVLASVSRGAESGALRNSRMSTGTPPLRCALFRLFDCEELLLALLVRTGDTGRSADLG